jgi:hypothetical protein
MASIERVNLSNNRLCELKGLEQFERVSRLNLSGNLIGEWEQLRFLPFSVTHVWLAGNPICAHPNYRHRVMWAVQGVMVIDGAEVTADERVDLEEARELQRVVVGFAMAQRGRRVAAARERAEAESPGAALQPPLGLSRRVPWLKGSPDDPEVRFVRSRIRPGALVDFCARFSHEDEDLAGLQEGKVPPPEGCPSPGEMAAELHERIMARYPAGLGRSHLAADPFIVHGADSRWLYILYDILVSEQALIEEDHRAADKLLGRTTPFAGRPAAVAAPRAPSRSPTRGTEANSSTTAAAVVLSPKPPRSPSRSPDRRSSSGSSKPPAVPPTRSAATSPTPARSEVKKRPLSASGTPSSSSAKTTSTSKRPSSASTLMNSTSSSSNRQRAAAASPARSANTSTTAGSSKSSKARPPMALPLPSRRKPGSVASSSDRTASARTASALDDGGRSGDEEQNVVIEEEDEEEDEVVVVEEEIIDEEGPDPVPVERVEEVVVEEPEVREREAAVLRAALLHWREVARRRGLRREAVHALKRADRSGILSRTFHHWSSSASSSRAGTSVPSRESSLAGQSPRMPGPFSPQQPPYHPQQHHHHLSNFSLRSPSRGLSPQRAPGRRLSADTVELRGLVGGLSYPPSWHPRNNPPKPAERPAPAPAGPPAYFEPTVSFLLKTSDDFHQFRPNPNHPFNRVEVQKKRFDKMVSTYWFQDDFLARQRLAELVNQKLGGGM